MSVDNGLKPKHTFWSREQRIEILLKMMKEKGDQSEAIVLSKFCLQEGVSWRIAREYLSILKLAGKLDATI